MSIANKLIYLNGTKEKLKDSINNIGGSITDETTFRAYAEELDNIYTNLPKTTGEGSNLSLTTLKGRINVDQIKGDTEQDTTTGKQLLNMPNGSQTTNGITFTRNNDILTYSGSATGSYADAYTFENYDVPIGTYTFSIDHTTSNSERIVLYLQGSGGNTNFIIYGGQTSVTITTTEAKTKIKVGLTNLTSGTSYSGTFKLMFNSGSTALPYEPYTNGASPNPSYPQDINVVTGTQEVVVQNRNLLTGIEPGDINSTTGAETSTTGAVRSTNYIPYDTETYYYASVNNAHCSVGLNIRFYNKNKEYIGYGSSKLEGAKNISITITTSVADTTPKYFKIRSTLSGGAITSVDDKVLISTTNDYSYVEHQEQTKTLHLGDIELSKIGTYQDRIYKNNDKWYIEKNIGKVVLNGSETGWGTQNDVFCIEINDILTQSYEQRSVIVLSNYFLGAITNYRGGMNNLTIAKTIDGGRPKQLGIRYDALNNVVDDFKTWLSTHNVELLYVLATPTYTEITNETLLNELNEIEKMMSYNGQTNISISGNLPMLLSVSALKGE